MSRYSYRRVKALDDAYTPEKHDFHGACVVDGCHRVWATNRRNVEIGSVVYNRYAVAGFLLGMCSAHARATGVIDQLPSSGLFDQHLAHGGGVWRGCKRHGRQNHCSR